MAESLSWTLNIPSQEDLTGFRKVAKSFEKFDPDRRNFLITREWWTPLHDKLQALIEQYVPGTHVVAAPDPENILDTQRMMTIGGIARCPTEGYDLLVVQMRMGDCHNNCWSLLKKQKIEKIMSGWALATDDPLWRYHSWGVDKEGRIVETSVRMLCYVGCEYVRPKKQPKMEDMDV